MGCLGLGVRSTIALLGAMPVFAQKAFLGGYFVSCIGHGQIRSSDLLSSSWHVNLVVVDVFS